MANTSDIRKGLCINFNNDLYQIVDFLHVKPGKGNAYVRTTLKSITTGRTLDHTFPAGHAIDPVRVERRVFQYLYDDEFAFHFMSNETYEDRKSTRLNSSHVAISYAVFCLKKKRSH